MTGRLTSRMLGPTVRFRTCGSSRRSSRSTTTWSSRPRCGPTGSPAKHHDVGPRIVRAPVKEMTFIGGKFTPVVGEPGDGPDVDWWFYEDLRRPLHSPRRVGRSRPRRGAPRRHHLRLDAPRRPPGETPARGHGRQLDRGVALLSHVPALLRPDVPRGEGQGAGASLCAARTTTGWSTSGAATSGGRLVPLCLIPLWDAPLAALEVRRNAKRGVHAVCFSEIPPFLGLPSVHDVVQLLGPVLRRL